MLAAWADGAQVLSTTHLLMLLVLDDVSELSNKADRVKHSGQAQKPAGLARCRAPAQASCRQVRAGHRAEAAHCFC